jgi:hypothetical protein
MKTTRSLLAGAALGALLGAGAVAPAEAATKTVKHHARHPSAASTQAAEINALKEQVQALTDRLNAQEASQQQVQQQAAQAQATAQAVQAQADSQIKTIPDQVSTAIAASMPKPKKSWADDTSISGRMYYNLSNVDDKKDGSKITPSGTGFDIKRFYVGIDHKFNDVFSANVTTDFNYVSADSETQVFIKKAYLQAKFSDALVVRAGSADLPWVPFVEDLYGYRYIENTLIDRTKFGTSADWGVHASGKFADGIINYAVSVVDGAGYKAPLRSKGMDVEGRISAKYDDFTVGVGGYEGKLGKSNEGVVTHHTAERFDAVAAYTPKKYRIGVEYFSAKNWNNVTTVGTDSSNGYSVFGSYSFTDKVGVFGRYDWVKPNDDTNSALKDHYFNVGISYTPVKIIDIALVYKRDKADNGIISTSNGNIGGVRSGAYDEVGLFGQLRW